MSPTSVTTAVIYAGGVRSYKGFRSWRLESSIGVVLMGRAAGALLAISADDTDVHRSVLHYLESY